MSNITDRLNRITRELAAIAQELQGQARGRIWQPSKRTQEALAITRAFVAASGGCAPRIDCCYNLIHRHGFGRSVAHEHMRRLILRGLLQLDAAGNITLPDVKALL